MRRPKEKARGSAPFGVVRSPSSFAGGDLLADVGVDIKGSNHRFGLKQVPNCFLDRRVLLAMVLLGVFSLIPEADP